VRRPAQPPARSPDPPGDLEAREIVVGGARYVVLCWAPGAEPSVAALTPGERRIAEAVLGGLSNADIGRLRGTSTRTVANQLQNLYRKLGVRSRTELAARFGPALSPVGGGEGEER
jgi:DNA-binding NarL/FixJ family response regulator